LEYGGIGKDTHAKVIYVLEKEGAVQEVSGS
jgi:hypothetical protein